MSKIYTFGTSKFIFKFSLTFCLLLILGFAPVNALHRFHTSLTVMDYKAEEKNIEISMQLFIHDLTQVLELKHNKQINLEKAETDKLIFEYLTENFNLQNSDGQFVRLNWVGKEIEIDKIYVYLEIPFEGNLEGQKMQNSIFFEAFQEQTNLVILKFGHKKTDLLFKVGDKLKEIQVDSKKELDS